MREHLTQQLLAQVGAFGWPAMAGLLVIVVVLAALVPRLLAFVLFCGFLLILIDYVPRWDLGAVLVVTALLAAYDIFIHRSPDAG